MMPRRESCSISRRFRSFASKFIFALARARSARATSGLRAQFSRRLSSAVARKSAASTLRNSTSTSVGSRRASTCPLVTSSPYSKFFSAMRPRNGAVRLRTSSGSMLPMSTIPLRTGAWATGCQAIVPDAAGRAAGFCWPVPSQANTPTATKRVTPMSSERSRTRWMRRLSRVWVAACSSIFRNAFCSSACFAPSSTCNACCEAFSFFSRRKSCAFSIATPAWPQIASNRVSSRGVSGPVRRLSSWMTPIRWPVLSLIGRQKMSRVRNPVWRSTVPLKRGSA